MSENLNDTPSQPSQTVLDTFRCALFAACLFAALIMLIAHLFPALHGPNWQAGDLLISVVFLLFAIAIKK